MTARRNDTGTAMRRGFARPSSRTAAPAEATPAPAPEAAPAPKDTKPPMTKYTALLDLDTADAFDGLARAARRHTGKTIGKAEILRALILLAADDASLRDQLMAELRK